MGMFEYVSVLTSIIVGLGLAHLLQGVARLVQHPGRTRTYWVHLLWVFYMFFAAIFWWWYEFGLVSVETWTFNLYLFVLTYAVLLYLICALLFPSDLEGYSGFEDYFLDRRAWFFGCLATFFMVDLVDSWLKGAEHLSSLGAEYLVSTGAHVLLFLIAMYTQNRKFHGGLAVLVVVRLLWWAMRNFTTVG
jgi:hypothetical protein